MLLHVNIPIQPLKDDAFQETWDDILLDADVFMDQTGEPSYFSSTGFSDAIARDFAITPYFKTEEESLLSGSDLQFSESVDHRLPAAMKVALVGSVVIGYPLWKLYQALMTIKLKIEMYLGGSRDY